MITSCPFHQVPKLKQWLWSWYNEDNDGCDDDDDNDDVDEDDGDDVWMFLLCVAQTDAWSVALGRGKPCFLLQRELNDDDDDNDLYIIGAVCNVFAYYLSRNGRKRVLPFPDTCFSCF